MIDLIDEAVQAGARQRSACEVLGLPERTLQRWRRSPEDRRLHVIRSAPNRLSDLERRQVVVTATSPEFRDLSPKQIVPRLADQGQYLASESTFYRVLRTEGLLAHRGAARPPSSSRAPRRHVANGVHQVWSWDITYLKAPVRGVFYFLYLIVDIWSRKIVGWEVHERESPELAAQLFARTCLQLDLDPAGLVLHSDNGGPMKGSTMLATLQRLGVVPSFSRPRVSDDNPYSEALFRTLKYRPEYPTKAFASLDEARAWVTHFVRWYNTEHLHSGLNFVTPEDRHAGRDAALLARRHQVYLKARALRPERWSQNTRDWSPVGAVYLNPDALPSSAAEKAA
jgi:transposase InsO family protein